MGGWKTTKQLPTIKRDLLRIKQLQKNKKTSGIDSIISLHFSKRAPAEETRVPSSLSLSLPLALALFHVFWQRKTGNLVRLIKKNVCLTSPPLSLVRPALSARGPRDAYSGALL